VDVIVDDTPGVIVVSGFDPVRREVARMSMERLIQDGRIHPARIERSSRRRSERSTVRSWTWERRRRCRRTSTTCIARSWSCWAGCTSGPATAERAAALDRGGVPVPVMADELGLDGTLPGRCGLLHDIGKAVDHEVEAATRRSAPNSASVQRAG